MGRLKTPLRLLSLVFLLIVLAARSVKCIECPDFPKVPNCAPHSAVDQCKYDADCTESNDHKCCLIGCQKMCLNPSLIEASISGHSVCPILPRPSPCPNEPNECTESDPNECLAGQKCCSDGCRMICVEPITVATTQRPTTLPQKTCNAIVDLAFIIDSSGSIRRRDYIKLKTFMKDVAESFGISPSGSHAGIVLYSTSASVKAHFGQYPTTEEFVKAVDRLPHERGLTYINLALRLAASELFARARKNVPKVAMLLTDGMQTNPDGTVNLREASEPLRREGVRVLAFGVGKNINVRELRLIVERDEDVIRVTKFDDLAAKVRNYTANLCQAAETEPIHPDADIIFLVDSSTGVSSQQFDMEKQFVGRMARYFIVSPLGPRAAFVSYSTTSYTVISFSGYTSTGDFRLKINSAPFLGGRRRIDQALIHAAKLFQETGRVGLRIVILLTAGNYYMGPGANSMSSVMSSMHSLDAHIYVIGIGAYFTLSMFTPMVRGPADIFELPSFNDLAPWQSRIARQLRLSTNAFKYEPAYWRADVIFLMDSSKYITASNYLLEKNFVKLMARLLNLASNRSRVALYTFGDLPQLEISFDGYQDREAFDAAVNKAPQLQGNRSIDKALESAAELLRTKSRATVPKYVVLLTTGTQTVQPDARSLVDASRVIRSYGGRVFVVAILTGGYTINEFYPAVQRLDDAFPVSSFTNLLPRAPSIAARIMASWRAPTKQSFAADVVFIVDCTSAVSPFQYTRAKRFVRILSEYLNISPGKSRGAMVTFGETPVVVFSFDSYKSHPEFRTKVTDASYLGGEPSISSTLRTAGTLFSDARGSYPWIAILVTPWRPTDIQNSRTLEIAARPLLNRGIWLYVLSIGENPYVGWLRPMLVESRDAFSVVSYRDLPANIGPVASYITNDNYLYGHSTFELDILFLMDTSSGVDLQGYKMEKGFVQRIALRLGVFNRGSRAALVAYGANSLIIFGFGGYGTNAEFVKRLNEAPMFGGERRVDRALDTAAALMLGARSTIPKAVVLIMAGKQSSAPNALSIKDAARPLHHLGAWLYIMSIGQSDARELQKATIRPTDVFFARSFSGLYGYIAPVARYIANTSVITGTSPLNTDIVFIIDCSSSVPYREFGTQKSFVRSLVQFLNIQPGQSRAAVVIYGSRALSVIGFQNSQNSVRFDSVLTRAPYLGGDRRFDKALDIARNIFGNARENVPKVMLLFMAGKQAQISGAISLKDAIKPLQQQGVTTFIFRIGSEPGIKELLSAVDRPGNIFTFSRFADMDARVPSVARHIPFYSALLAPFSFAIDVVYLIDSSDPVTTEQYVDQKVFVKYLARYLNMMPSRSRGAVITYGVNSTVVTNLGETSTTQDFGKAVNNAPKIGGQRRMDRAVDAALTVLGNARPATPKVVILLTTGNQAAGIEPRVLETAFQRLYGLGARLYALTIKTPPVPLPLRSTDGSDWFPVTSYLDLPIQVLPLARHIALDTAALGPHNFSADVIFMLDSSSRVTPEDYLNEKEFVKLIARYLNITPGKSRGSVIIFSTNATPILPFDGYTTMSDFNAVIDRASQLSGSRRIDRAFRLAVTLFQSARPSVRKVAILLTGGRQSPDGGSLQEAMRPMRDLDVTTYVIAIGSQSDVPVQRTEDLFTVTSFDDLPRQVQPIATNITKPSAHSTPTGKTTPALTPTITQAPTTPDPCKTEGCSAPYNIGCRVVDNKAQCICPSCPNIRRPVCASDGVQDLTECHLKQQACQADITVTVKKQGTCDKECRSLVDIAFIIDSSGSIGRRNWERMKRFVKAMVSKLDVSNAATHVAAIAYSNNPEVVWRFRNFQGTDDVNRVIDRMPWQRGFTYTDKALLFADRDLFQTFNGMRLNVPKLAVVITDGKQTTTGQYTRLSVASRGIKNKGVTVYAVGVGGGADKAELEEIASGPEYVFISSSFKELENISLGLTRRLCEDATPTPKATTTTTPTATVTTPTPTTPDATPTPKATTTITPTATVTTPTPTTPDPCERVGCNAPYNIGCRVVDDKAQCICPTCPMKRRPVCASDGVQDLSECHMRQQACQANVTVVVVKQGPCDKECRSVVDIAFIIDSSGSIGRRNWERMKRFVKAMVSKLDVSNAATHIAAIAYSNNPEIVWRFRYFQGTDEVNRVIDRMRWQRGFTYTDKALQLADRDLFQTSNGMRFHVPKLAVVITDGKQTTTGQYTRLSVASQGIKNKGVTVYAVGVGRGADRAELEEIASGSQYVFTSSSFKELQNISLGLTRRLCEDATPTTKAVTTSAPTVTSPTPTTPDPCKTEGCSAPYNIGCRVVDNKAQCICPTCPMKRSPVCASDGVQDLSECHMKQQACLADVKVTVKKQGTCDKECRSVLDIAFIIDSSGSIGRRNWERIKRFLKALVSKLDVSNSATHVAAVAYSNNPEVVMLFRNIQGTDEVNRVLDRMRWLRGYTYTDRALLLADRYVFQISNGMRASVTKMAVVITDGKQTITGQYTRLSVASQGIKNKGVTVYAVGVGSGADKAELEEIASAPEYVFTSSSFKELQDISLGLTKRLCQEATPTTKAVTTPTPKVTTPTPTTSDPCMTESCSAPYNVGCRVVDNKAQCICPTCPNIRRPVCASDGVQDLSECHMRQQACLADVRVTVAKQGTCDKECRSVLDIAFIIDSSGSIGRRNWERMKRFLKALVSKLDVSNSVTHVAAIAYSNNPIVEMRFWNTQGTDEVNRVFDRMLWQRGYTYTDKALQLADRDLFQTANGMRPSVLKLAVVITDGKQTTTGQYTKLSVASQGIKNKGVTVYAVGVGSGADKAELEEIASGPEYVFTSSSFKDLQNISLGLTKRLCQEATPTPEAVTTPTPKVTIPTPAPTTPDPCRTEGCSAPYNVGCRVVDNKAQCICPTCLDVRRPVCASDGVQDLSECRMKQQACLADVRVTVAKQGTCDRECRSVVDIAFIIDSSGSIGRRNWERMKRFLKAMVSRLDVSNSATHVAAIAYSTNPIVEMRFWNTQGTEEVNRVFDRMLWQRGYTYTDKALQLAARDLFKTGNGMRPNVPKLAIVITDGKQTTTEQYTRLSVASQGIKNKGVTVFAVGVGSEVDQRELREIASGPNNVFTPSSFNELQGISSEITRLLCEAVATSPPIPTTTPITTTTQITTLAPTTPDPCQTEGCTALYNIGCRVVNSTAQCICPTCPNIRKPVCASDGVQDLSQCHLKQQACRGDIVTFVAKEGPCDKECRSIVDIAFIIDSSGSIGRRNWEKMKRFIKASVSKLDVSNSATHVAAIAYSTNPRVVMRFSDVQDTDEVNRVVDQMAWQRGYTYTDKALLLADRDLFQTSRGMRPNVAKIAIVVTDGKQTTTGGFTRLAIASGGLKNKGVTVYAVGVGYNVDRDELEEIASSPDYVLTSSSFRALQTTAPQIRKAVCEDPKAKYSADVLFIVDSSSDTTATYNTEKDLVKYLARYINVNPRDTRAALVLFNSRPMVISDFESFSSARDFESAVDRAPHLGGDRSVSDALQTAAGMFPNSPSSVSKVIFLVTSGKPLNNNDDGSMGDVIDKLSSLGVRTYVVLVGPTPSIEEFASKLGNPENVFAIEAKSDLSKQINRVGSQVLTDSVIPKKLNLTMYVLFVVDSSAEVSPSNFTQEKEFIKSLISQLNIYPANSSARVGIMVFSGGATMVLNFQNKESKSSLEAIVDNLPHLRGSRRIDNALKAATVTLNDVDSDVPKFVVLLIAGRQTDEPGSVSFGAAVRPLQLTGTKTHVMAIGDDIDPSYFQEEEQEKTNVISVPTFSDLPESANRVARDLLSDYVAPKEPPTQAGTTTTKVTSSPLPTTTEMTTPTVTLTTTEPSITVGSPSPSDIVFLFDTSNGVTQSDLRQQKEFVKLLAKHLGVSPSHSHAAVLSYSDRPRLKGGFYANLRGTSFEEIVDSVTLTGGKRNIEEALKQTRRMHSLARPTVPYVVFLITFGQQAPDFGSAGLQESAKNLRDMGANLYVIGIGVDVSKPQLQQIVKRPSDVFEIPTSDDFQSYVQPIAYYVASRLDNMVPDKYKAEVIYVLDSSSFVGKENYKLEKEFTKALARMLNHGPTGTKSAVIIFDSFPERPIRMGSYTDIGRFSEAVDNLRYLGGSSQLDFALTIAAVEFSTDSPKVPKIVIVLTNKDPSRRGSIESLAETFRQEGKIVNVVGIGNDTDFPNLRRLAVRPEDMFTPKSFDDLMSFVPNVAANILALTIPPTTTPLPTPVAATTFKVTSSKQTTATTKDVMTTKLTTLSTRTTPAEQTTTSAGTTPLTRSTASTSKPTPTSYPPTRPKKTDFCPVRFTVPCPGDHLCEHDRQCPGKQRCCKHSCGFLFCSDVVKRDKPGSCPYIPRPSSCSSRSTECNYDMECTGDLKCCDDGCGKICVSTSYTPPTVGFLANRCPPYSPNKQCPGSVQDECTCDSDCDEASDYKCCFDGCRRLCRKKAGQICTAKVDIIYLMDSSGSIGHDDYEKQKDFVKDLARVFRIGPGASRAAVVTYDDFPIVRANFDDFDSTDSFAEAVESINQTRGRTRIDRALVKTSEMFKSARKNVPKVLIALTDGAQTPDPGSLPLDEASQLLRDQGVKVYALGVGHQVNVTQLRSMVESNSDVFLVDSFVDLLRKSQSIAEKACSEIGSVTSCVQGVDIAFLMDSSESISDEDFDREKTAVKEIAASFLKASQGSRAGVIMYSGRPELSVDFISQSAFDNFKSAVDALSHRRSMTRIDRALRYASETLFANPRRSVISIAVVMTDGVQTPGPDVEPLGQAVLPLRLKGVRVLAVGVGPRVNRNELRDLVTSQEDVFQMSSFQELINKSTELLETVCPQPPPRPSTTTVTAKARTTKPTKKSEITTTKYSPTTPTITTPTSVECDKLLDIIFVMDSSRSINAPQYDREKDFVKKLAAIFNVGAGSRAAVIIYSDDTQLRIKFDQYSNLDSFLRAVDALPYLQKRTRIDKALALAAQVLKQAREGFPKAVIVMTDGRQTRDPDAVPLDIAADAIHKQEARVFVVGIGPEISMKELLLIARNPSNVFTVQSFEKLEKATRDVATSACSKSINSTRAPSKKPGSCPVFPFNIRCAVTISTCVDDSDCYGNWKCCFDNCRYICTPPESGGETTTTTEVTTTEVTSTEATTREVTTCAPILGSCPPLTVPPLGVCSSVTSDCIGDEQCSCGQLCCYDGCRRTCVLPAGLITGPPTTHSTTISKPVPQCAKAFDLGIAMDSSGSIRDANYQKEKNFVKGLPELLEVGPQTVQLGLIVFSDVPIISVRFGTLKSTDRTSFTASVDGVPYLRGRTRTDSVLESAATNLFPEGRQGSVPQVFFLMTDGRHSKDPGAVALDQAVQRLRAKGIKLIVVGIGDDVDENELRSLVENPVDDLFLVPTFDDLKPLLEDKRLRDALCIPKRRRLRRNSHSKKKGQS